MEVEAVWEAMGEEEVETEEAVLPGEEEREEVAGREEETEMAKSEGRPGRVPEREAKAELETEEETG